MPAPDRPEDHPGQLRRLGFLDGELAIPDEFDTMDADEIRAMLEDGLLFPTEVGKTKPPPSFHRSRFRTEAKCDRSAQRPGAAIAHVSLGWLADAKHPLSLREGGARREAVGG